MNARIFGLVGILTGVVALAATPEDSSKTGVCVSVEFVKPGGFKDVEVRPVSSEAGRERLLEDLRKAMTAAAESHLRTGLSLELRVTEVDLAGAFEPWRGPAFNDLRVVKDVYPPRLDLEFRLTDASGAVLREGASRLRDPNFLAHASPVRSADPLHYDKALFRDWLRTEFKAYARPRE